MIGITIAIVFTGLCIVCVGVMLERALDDLADNGLFIPAGDVEADIKRDPPGWPHVDEEHWRGCPICQKKEHEESK
jgi:hypothetical protein